MTALPDWDILSDSELTYAAVAGDRGAFAAIYDRYADRLHDFCAGMLRDREAAADCVQEAFCSAATNLSQLRDANKLKPWLYAIARHEALRHIQHRRREQAFGEVPESAADGPGPDGLAQQNELVRLVAAAADGLSDRDRAALDLTYRHGLDGPELAEALGVTPGTANRLVSRLRDTIERSLGALLVSRGVQQNPSGCPELADTLTGWDGKFDMLMRKRIARHIDSCAVCEEQRKRLVSPAALLAGAPLFIPAPQWLRQHTLDRIGLTSASVPLTDSGASSRRHIVGRAIALAAVLVVSAAVAAVWLHRDHVGVAPANLDTTTTARPSPASTAMMPPQPSLPAPTTPPPTPSGPEPTKNIAPSSATELPPANTSSVPQPPPAPIGPPENNGPSDVPTGPTSNVPALPAPVGPPVEPIVPALPPQQTGPGASQGGGQQVPIKPVPQVITPAPGPPACATSCRPAVVPGVVPHIQTSTVAPAQ